MFRNCQFKREVISKWYQRWERSSFLYFVGNRSCCNPFENNLRDYSGLDSRETNKWSLFTNCICATWSMPISRIFTVKRKIKFLLSLCVRSIIDTILPLKKTPTTAKHIYLRVHTSGGTWNSKPVSKTKALHDQTAPVACLFV